MIWSSIKFRENEQKRKSFAQFKKWIKYGPSNWKKIDESSDDDLLIDNKYLFKAKELICSDTEIVIIHANRIVVSENSEVKTKNKLELS